MNGGTHRALLLVGASVGAMLVALAEIIAFSAAQRCIERMAEDRPLVSIDASFAADTIGGRTRVSASAAGWQRHEQEENQWRAVPASWSQYRDG